MEHQKWPNLDTLGACCRCPEKLRQHCAAAGAVASLRRIFVLLRCACSSIKQPKQTWNMVKLWNERALVGNGSFLWCAYLAASHPHKQMQQNIGEQFVYHAGWEVLEQGSLHGTREPSAACIGRISKIQRLRDQNEARRLQKHDNDFFGLQN